MTQSNYLYDLIFGPPLDSKKPENFLPSYDEIFGSETVSKKPEKHLSPHEEYELYFREMPVQTKFPSAKDILIEFSYFFLNCFIFSIVIIVSAFFFENYPAWRSISGFIFSSCLILASVALHEFFHAFFAFIFGDHTIFDRGYLKLNILKYFHNFNSLFLPLLVFFSTGLFLPGAAVYINIENIKYRIFEFIVFIAGIFSQIIFLFFILTFLNSNIHFLSNEFIALLHACAAVQVMVLVFNLLPVPGLDGWGACWTLISPNVGRFISYYLFIPIMIVIMILFFLDSELFLPIVSLMDFLFSEIGIDQDLVRDGFEYLQIIDFSN